MEPENRLVRDFRCAKCRAREAVTRIVHLFRHGVSLPPFLGAGARERYILLSCALCGFTELYNASLLVAADEPGRSGATAETAPATSL